MGREAQLVDDATYRMPTDRVTCIRYVHAQNEAQRRQSKANRRSNSHIRTEHCCMCGIPSCYRSHNSHLSVSYQADPGKTPSWQCAADHRGRHAKMFGWAKSAADDRRSTCTSIDCCMLQKSLFDNCVTVSTEWLWLTDAGKNSIGW